MLSQVNLALDELEAIRLCDLEGLDQEHSALKMNVFRVTFLRIIHSAHKKIAEALIYSKAISMKGGDYIMPNFNGRGPLGRGRGRGMAGKDLGGSEDCVCPKCSEKVPHTKGIPCLNTKCPKCQSPMAGVFCR